jgi:hypothetical protein
MINLGNYAQINHGMLEKYICHTMKSDICH